MADVLEIHQAGLAAVTDLGRPGHAREGISANGAADQYSAAVANILVGNPETAPLIEITASTFTFSASCAMLIAITGAPAVVNWPCWEPVCVPAATPVNVSSIHNGLRTYLAVHGSLPVPRLLGSCAPDPLLEFGTWLRAGDQVAVDTDYVPFSRYPLFRLAPPVPRFGTDWIVDVVDGPDAADFGQPLAGVFEVGQANHIGLRLRGRAPARLGSGELLSRGVPAGAVEVTPAGELVVLLRGHPVTAGYPVIAVATQVAQSALGQAAPGHHLTFRRRSRAEAVADHRARRRDLDRLAGRVRTCFTELGISCSAQA